MKADVIVIGAGLAGLAAANEVINSGHTVLLVDQENEANLGGQAFWSFGGLFLVDTPEQRRLGVKDSFDLAWQDWQGSAAWDRLDGPLPQDEWASQWGRAYVEFAAGEARSWLREQGVSFTPMVGWAERGDGRAGGHGNSVPRFHVAWGTGTGVVGPFVEKARAAAAEGNLQFAFRHRVDRLGMHDGAITSVSGAVLAPETARRGSPSNSQVVGDFEFSAQAVIVTTGGLGGNHQMVRRNWPARLGAPPATMITGVPEYVDGRMLDIAESSGVRLVNKDRMWHYTEGIQNWDPVWPQHGIRILPGPSSMWFDALGRRLPAPGLPGYDTLGTLRLLRTDPAIAQYSHSWFILTQKMIEKEFALSGSEQNPDITNKDFKLLLKARLGKGAPAPVEAFKTYGADFVVANSLEELVPQMNALTTEQLLDVATLRAHIEQRDREMSNPFSKDAQVMGIHNARKYLGDRLTRVAAPHRILDPKAGPLIGVKLHILTRKTLGGIQTDLSSRALNSDGKVISGLYAAGEVSGFGGGGSHGYNALEGTFLGGCMLTGRTAGRAAAAAL
ncbi:FAD-binding dehydrogenase [Pseudarthrobacter sp. J1763]|uniref:FAD-binding dehydrogenase n=1 Tax=Pseudarthrobacter sp. J1763 TaxID=3420445 RepID=UPI003D2B0CAE